MYQKYEESQNIKRSMIVLSLSLILVYIILYYAKWDLWRQDAEQPTIVTWDVVISEITGREDGWVGSWGVNNTWLVLDPEKAAVNADSVADVLNDQNNTVDDTWNEEIILSWTKSYYGKLDFVEKLWISYKYALKDDKNIYYLNMWDYDYDFSDIVRKLKWSLYVMNTEQELIANGLFGEKVTFINIPEYKDQKVLILLEMNNGSWLLAIDYSIYHQVKPYLKTLFIN